MTQEALKLEREMKQLREVYAVQERDGSWEINDYLLGMLNGLELALSIMENRPPQYKIRKALAQTQEPVAHSVIAGVLFDFMGWLTSRKERIVLSSADNASPAVDAIRDFAKMRNLSLDDAKVLNWNTTPPQRTWVGLTLDEIALLHANYPNPQGFALALQAKLKEKNT